jgi:CheY-like chemotaxis protein
MNIPGPILVLDDDPDDHEIIRMLCENLKVCSSIIFFFNADELLFYLRTTQEQPFLILCDINMPLINGLEVRDIIWKDPYLRKKSIPFIFFSTSASKHQVDAAFEMTVQGFFLKGNSLDETERKLRTIFEYWLASKHPNSFSY